MAIQFSGWLYKEFVLKSFIDSTVWGYADDLLKIIDDRYFRSKDSQTYNYKKRNLSTSHLHMMLSNALNSMIDQCECVIFINTENSYIPPDLVSQGGNTGSPWIYSEISTTQIIKKKAREV